MRREGRPRPERRSRSCRRRLRRRKRNWVRETTEQTKRSRRAAETFALTPAFCCCFSVIVSESVNSDLSGILAEEEKVETSYQRADQRLADVCGKRERGQKHKSKAARDADLKKTLAKVKKQREDSQRQVDKLTEELAEAQSAASKMEADMTKKDKTVDANRAATEKINAQLVDLAKSRDAATNTRKETWKREAEIKSKLAEVNQTIHKAEDGLRFTMDKVRAGRTARASTAPQTLRRSLTFRSVCSSLLGSLPRCGGCSQDCCRIEASRCFRSTDRALHMQGRIPPSRRDHGGQHALQRRGGFKRHCVHCDSGAQQEKGRSRHIHSAGRHQPAETRLPIHQRRAAHDQAATIRQEIRKGVFADVRSGNTTNNAHERSVRTSVSLSPRLCSRCAGKTLIARELGVAATLARDYNLNTITLAGDRVDKKGALTGGYSDTTQRSRLQAQGDIVAAKQSLGELNHALEEVQTELRGQRRTYTSALELAYPWSSCFSFDSLFLLC